VFRTGCHQKKRKEGEGGKNEEHPIKTILKKKKKFNSMGVIGKEKKMPGR